MKVFYISINNEMRSLLVFLLLILQLSLHSQVLKLGIGSGIGFYSMAELKDLNDYISRTNTFKVKTVNNFPPFFYYRPAVQFSINDRQCIGLEYSFQSTGSRISGKDYSGNYLIDMKIHSNSPALTYSYQVFKRDKLSIGLQSEAGFDLSKLTINEYLEVLDSVLLNDDTEFKAANFHFSPGIFINYSFGKFAICISGEYCLQEGNEALYTDKNKDNILYNAETEKKVRAGWSGLRTGITLFYIPTLINRKKTM
jgi:hypothetical protein